jgi:hypothetical protein
MVRTVWPCGPSLASFGNSGQNWQIGNANDKIAAVFCLSPRIRFAVTCFDAAQVETVWQAAPTHQIRVMGDACCTALPVRGVPPQPTAWMGPDCWQDAPASAQLASGVLTHCCCNGGAYTVVFAVLEMDTGARERVRGGGAGAEGRCVCVPKATHSHACARN